MKKWREEDESDGYPMVAEGQYYAQVCKVEPKMTKADDERWVVYFKDVDTGGNLCIDSFVFSEAGKGIAFKKMKILGIKKGDDGYYTIGDHNDLIGLRCMLNIVHEEYNGKLYPKPDFGAENFGYEPVNTDDIPF